jgi:nitroreductase
MPRPIDKPPFVPLEFERLEPGEQSARGSEFASSMARRRSVRHFSSEPVPRELIELAIRAAAAAPSGANQQPWHFVAVSDPEIKRAIRVAAEAEEKENYEHRFPDEWLGALAQFGTTWEKPFLETCPWLIAVFRLDYGVAADGARIKHYYVQESVGIAAGILITALHRMGLATLTHTPSPMGFLSRILERPANERPFLLIPAGYPARDCQVPAISRKPFDAVATFR